MGALVGGLVGRRVGGLVGRRVGCRVGRAVGARVARAGTGIVSVVETAGGTDADLVSCRVTLSGTVEFEANFVVAISGDVTSSCWGLAAGGSAILESVVLFEADVATASNGVVGIG
jgi:hypothetical protein